MKKILINVAAVSPQDRTNDPKKIAEDVIACAKAGAGMVHLHVRDRNNNLTKDLTNFKETIERIRDKSDIIIEASTGGISNLTIEERCSPLSYDKVEAASLNIGSVNLGNAIYKNAPKDIEYCISQIRNSNKLPEIEIFELGMIHTALKFRDAGALKNPLLFSLVLGQEGAMPATGDALLSMVQFLPKDVLWGITHYGRTNYQLMAAALGLGAVTVRVGLEDSNYINETTKCDQNLPMVERISSLLESLDLAPATAQDARLMLNI